MKYFLHGLPIVAALSCFMLDSAFGAESGERATYNLTKNFDELTPAERNLARSTAKTAKLDALRVCADPGNMPLSNQKGDGYENKIVEVLAKAMDTKVSYFWRPYQERGLISQSFDSGDCDVLLDVPGDFQSALTTTPIYRTTYVFAFRTDSGLEIKSLDDPKLKDLRVGVFQQSSLRQALANHGVVQNVKIHVISYDTDLDPETQPWRQVQEVVDGKLDIAGVWGPFAGYVLMQGGPITVLPVNRMDDDVQLEFDLALGVRKNDVVLKYMLDNALEKSKSEIKTILTDFRVPLVECSRCIVSGDIPSHGTYFTTARESARNIFLNPLPESQTKLDTSAASADQIVTDKRVDKWLKEGSDINQELSNAVIASDKERVAFLLEKGADIGKLNPQGLAPLHSAARQRDSDMIAFLIKKGADVNERDSDGWTPLLHASFRNHVPSVTELAKAGADVNEAAPGNFTPLAIAIAEGKFFAAKALLDAGAKVNLSAGEEGLTPLMLIASQPLQEARSARLDQGPSSVDVAKLLIDDGADLNAKSTKGVTPLMVAASHDNPPLVSLLIQRGADPDIKTPDGKTALDIAKMNRNEAAQRQIEILTGVRPNKAAPSPDTAQGGEPSAGQ